MGFLDRAALWALGGWALQMLALLAWKLPPWAHWWCKLSPSDWAAWVQAIGSVFAIAAAVAAVELPHRRQANKDRLEAAAKDARLKEAVFQLVGAVYQVLDNASEIERPDQTGKAAVRIELLGLTDALAKFTPTDLETYDSISAVLDAISWARRMADYVERSSGHLHPLGDQFFTVQAVEARDHVKSKLDILWKNLGPLQNRRLSQRFPE